MPITDTELLALADRAREHAYCPYSHFAVGAALLCQDGTVYTGCNVENGSYPNGFCAEQTAFCKAVSEGKTKGDFEAIAIAGDPERVKLCSPCGKCRQVMAEFCGDSFRIILRNGNYTLGELFPLRFELQAE